MTWWTDSCGNSISSGSSGDSVYDTNGNLVGTFDSDGETVLDKYGNVVDVYPNND